MKPAPWTVIVSGLIPPDPADAPTKRCTNCFQDKPLDQFHRSSHIASGRRSVCIPCAREIDGRRRERNEED